LDLPFGIFDLQEDDASFCPDFFLFQLAISFAISTWIHLCRFDKDDSQEDDASFYSDSFLCC
jgi:hypothetical protein